MSLTLPDFEFQDSRLPALIQQIAPGSRLLRAWPLKGGISAEMTAFEIGQPDGQTRRLVLRRPTAAAFQNNPQAIVSEYYLLRLLQPLGLLTPRPCHLAPPSEHSPSPALILEYIHGQPDFNPADRQDAAMQMAAQLARIHQAGSLSRPIACLPLPTLRIDEIIPPVSAPDSPLPAGTMRAALESAWPFPHPNPPALLHGDYWPGNILWQDGKLVGVIDWEDARRGDPLADLAISRLDLLCIFGAAAMQTFTRQYQTLSPVDFRDLPYWDLCAALRLARLAGPHLDEWAAFFHPYQRADISAQTIQSAYHSFTRAAQAQLNLI